MLKRIHVFYSGRVQGVGFRFTTEDLAQRFNISGWVRNLRDGRVELVAEAEESRLDTFLSSIESYFKNYILDIDIQKEKATEEFGNFAIKF